MGTLAEQLLEEGYVTTPEGKRVKLRAHTRRGQCYFLQRLVRAAKPTVSVEIGLAHGISALFLCEALREVGAERHIICDPYQHAENWQGVGLHYIEKAGFADLVDFYEEKAETLLPQLLKEEVRIGFAYVDASKRFDSNLVTFYFLTQLLKVGGLLAFDDCGRPGLRKLMRSITKRPAYRVYDTYIPRALRNVYKERSAKRWLNRLVREMPYADKIFAPELIETDAQLGLKAHCVAFQKVD